MAEKLFSYKNITDDKVFLIDELSQALLIEKGEVLRLTYLEVVKYSKSLTDMLNAKYLQLYEDASTDPVKVFIELTDVPSSYAGHEGHLVVVKNTVDGLEFSDPALNEDLRGPEGPPGPAGAPFTISKIYPSVAAMEADFSTTSVLTGQFIIIETSNPDDLDNSKLYIKGETAWEFVTDLSGAQGIQGPAGNTPQMRTAGGYIQVSTDLGVTWSNLISLASLTGPAGDDGDDGNTPLLRLNGSSLQVSYDNGTTWSNLLTIADITGPKGDDGLTASITVGTTETVDHFSPAEVTNSGDVQNAVFNFKIPKGVPGVAGDTPTITIGTVTQLNPGQTPTVTNSGTDIALVLNFGIPQGNKGTDGDDGVAATITVGTVSTLPTGSNATVENAGTSSAAKFNFGIPRGATGTTPQLRSNGGYIQVSLDQGNTWTNLVQLETLMPSFSINSNMELIVNYPDI